MATSKKGNKKTAKKSPKKQVKKAVKKVVKKTLKKAPGKKAAKTRAAITRAATTRSLATVELTALDTLYILDGSDDVVTLEVNAGAAGQASDMSIELDGSSIADKLAGDFPETALGTNRELNRKRLRIVATIADLSRETNVTSLTVRLKGGPADTDFLLAKEVEEEGGSVDYICLIRFFQPS